MSWEAYGYEARIDELLKERQRLRKEVAELKELLAEEEEVVATLVGLKDEEE